MTAQGRIVWVSGPAVRADGMADAKCMKLSQLEIKISREVLD